ncbi:TIGR01777 family oxidoreductase [Anaeromyxobacter diazotrophicus]|uniref:Epimerase n=1 Tax=Anaeromyxobacter diazotrophicus TaxID=2590199 RepID=A0A7I9VGJ8_9BACT|nr:TIGR01777 family oxidoreductase [Anaeromyxobacter diazotrophicus]GEJ55513.1 epimerase [Anaeromyxobacter diazotrophicus]
MHVFLTGATGLIGRALVPALRAAGHEVTALSRGAAPGRSPSGAAVVQGDPTRPGAWQDALARCDACVHLAGEPVAAGRWTEERKRAIRESRLASTRLVAEVVARGGPAVLVSGSAVGYYGSRGDEELDEGSPPGRDFLAEVCVAWEAAAAPAAVRARVVLLRTGIVLARDGGALPQLLRPFRYFAGGHIGDGAFWQPWIHLADEVGLITWALEHGTVAGPLAAAAPAPARNRDLAHAIGEVLHRPSVLPVPRSMIELVLGELAGAVTASQRVLPRKALAGGYRFRYPELLPALRDLLAR